MLCSRGHYGFRGGVLTPPSNRIHTTYIGDPMYLSYIGSRIQRGVSKSVMAMEVAMKVAM